MKKIVLLLIALTVSQLAFSQAIAKESFPETNEIDTSFNIDLQKLNSDYEIEACIVKYVATWKHQMTLEMNRLISILPKQKKAIIKDQKEWEKSVLKSFNRITTNVDLNKIGSLQKINLEKERLQIYKDRSIYYLCLYYEILLQKNPELERSIEYKLAE